MSKHEKHPLWIVTWIDAAHPVGEWTEIEGADVSMAPVHSVGFKITHTTLGLKLACTVDGIHNPHYFTAEIDIPRACIQTIVELPRNGEDARKINPKTLRPFRSKKPSVQEN